MMHPFLVVSIALVALCAMAYNGLTSLGIFLKSTVPLYILYSLVLFPVKNRYGELMTAQAQLQSTKYRIVIPETWHTIGKGVFFFFMWNMAAAIFSCIAGQAHEFNKFTQVTIISGGCFVFFVSTLITLGLLGTLREMDLPKMEIIEETKESS